MHTRTHRRLVLCSAGAPRRDRARDHLAAGVGHHPLWRSLRRLSLEHFLLATLPRRWRPVPRLISTSMRDPALLKTARLQPGDTDAGRRSRFRAGRADGNRQSALP
eukprot:175768-Pleurochrysis_carterae.AAC.1